MEQETNPKLKRPYRKSKKLKGLPDFSTLPAACSDAATILTHAHGTASALLKAYELLRRRRGASRGMTTDEEQDLLRAMLVMTAAGLDGMAKQLIRDCLPTLARHEEAVLKGLRKFIASELGRGPESSASFMANVLSGQNTFSQVIEGYIRDLTGGSLQSVDEILSTAAALGVVKDDLGVNVEKLRKTFEIRNRIIHELDMDLEGERRKRNIRAQKDMVERVEFIFDLSTNLLRKVGDKVKQYSKT